MQQPRELNRGDIVRELRPVYQAAVSQGWRVMSTGGGHTKWLSPTGQPVFTSGTPSDPRGIKNHIAKLRREGLRYDG